MEITNQEKNNFNLGYLFFVIGAVLILFGTCSGCISRVRDEFKKLQAPIIVIAIQKPKTIIRDGMVDKYESGSIVLRDSNGRIWSCNGGYDVSDALIESYNLGDTIQ